MGKVLIVKMKKNKREIKVREKTRHLKERESKDHEGNGVKKGR